MNDLEKKLMQLKMKNELGTNPNSFFEEYKILLSENIKSDNKFEYLYRDIKNLFSLSWFSSSGLGSYEETTEIIIERIHIEIKNSSFTAGYISVLLYYSFISDVNKQFYNNRTFIYSDKLIRYKLQFLNTFYCYDIFYCINNSIKNLNGISKLYSTYITIEYNLYDEKKKFTISNIEELNNFDLFIERYINKRN